MKKRLEIVILSILIPLCAYGNTDVASVLPIKQLDKLFVGLVENRKNQLDKLTQERAVFIKQRQETDAELSNLIEEAKNHIALVSRQLEQTPDSAFVKQKLLLLNDSYQVFKDLKREREKTVAVVDDLAKLMQAFLDDPEYITYRKEQKLTERPFYSFEDLQKINSSILDQEKKIVLLQDQEKHSTVELENRKKTSAATVEAYKAKQEQTDGTRISTFDLQQTKEITGLEERLFTYRKMLDEIRIKEIGYKLELISLELSMAKSHLSMVRDYLRMIKPSVRVSEADIIYAKEELAKATNKSRIVKEQYRLEIDRIVILQDRIEDEIEELSRKYSLPIGKDISEWTREAQQTVDFYVAYSELGTLQTRLITYQKKQELLDTQIDLEDEKLKETALILHVKESYNKKFNTEEEILHELKRYEVPKAESEAGIARFKEKISTVADQINNQKKILDNIQNLKHKIQKQRETIFKSHAVDFNRCLELLSRAEALEKDQIDILSRLTGSYSGLTSIMNNRLRIITFIMNELESRTIWHRPDWAISLEGLKNVIPDITNFLSYTRAYVTMANALDALKKAYDYIMQPLDILFLLIKLLLVFAILFMLRRLVVPLATFLIQSDSSNGLIRVINLFIGALIQFADRYFISISLWLVLLSALFFSEYNTYASIFFYLLSIPYLLYLSNRFFKFIARFNEVYDYPFLAQDFQNRFLMVISILTYFSIVICLFREAFMLTHYYRSELPTILLALNFIVFQIALILLIDKEQILGMIPTHTDFWFWVHKQVDKFYYFIMLVVIAIIVMSNPYVGFGRLVLYVFFGLMYSVVLFLGLYLLHGLFKRSASRIFFTSVDDMARERFPNAKTWFGLTIIFSFFLLTFFGLVIAAKIWGWPITVLKIKELLYFPIIGAESKNPITSVSFLQIFLFVLIGFIVAYALNRFVLDRVFDLLLVDPGVQHTVTSITQYIVILIAVFLGFQSAKLGEIVQIIMGALILGLGLILKDPITDFVAYFIILVQRPLKIGDYISIDEDITGVVRQITARAVILRRKNSTTLIVPNSYVISHTITNWNYTRGFIAFDDIIIRVDYNEDPQEVRKILYEVVEEHPNILKNPKPWVRLDAFTELGYEFMVRGFISSVYTLEKWEIASNIRIAIVKRFEERGIRFAIPSRVVLTRSNSRLGDSTRYSDSPKG